MPDWKELVRARLTLPRIEPEREAELVEEVASVLEESYGEALARGASPAEAEASALARLGDPAVLGRELQAGERRHRKSRAAAIEDRLNGHRGRIWTGVVLEGLVALRNLRRNPASAVAAAAVLALGIGASTALFSVAHPILVRQLPYLEPERLGVIEVDAMGREGLPMVTDANLVDFREQSRTIEAMARMTTFDIALTDEAGSREVSAALTGASIFDLLGVRPIAGRSFDPDVDAREDAYGNVVLSAELWHERYGGSPDVLGRTVMLDEDPVQIVGVAPPGLRLLVDGSLDERIDLWSPRREIEGRGTVFRHRVLARLAPGTTFEEASAELDAIAARARRLDGELDDEPATYHLTPLQDNLVEPVRPALVLLLAAGGCVLLLVSSNAASLLLIRSLRRQHDWAIRSALGAGKLRLVRQCLMESSLLALCGAVPGVALGAWGCRALLRLNPVDLPRSDEIGLDGAVLTLALLVTLGSGLVAGVLPAWRAARTVPARSLRARGASGAGLGWGGRVLAAAEVAIALTLVVATGLIVQSLIHLRSVDLGFDPDRVLTLHVPLPESLRGDETRLQLDRELVARTRALPDVKAVGLTNSVPLASSMVIAAWAHDDASADRFGDLVATFQRTWPGYFEAMGIPLLAGRDFERGDTEHRRDVVVVDEGLARVAWPGENPLGRRVLIQFLAQDWGTENRWAEVVGLVPTVRRQDLHSLEEPQIYLPYWPETNGQTLVVRTQGDPMRVVPSIRRIVDELGTGRPLTEVASMADHVADASRETRFLLGLVGAFAGVALLLASLGVYGTSAHLVGERTREIGVRMALGADRRTVFRTVLAQGLAVTAAGVAAGLGAAFVLTRSMRAVLHGVSPHDPLTVAIGTLALVIVAAVASAVPASRATRIDPLASIRAD